MKKLFFGFGTRPEAIKIAPVVREAVRRGFDVILCSTSQHTDLLTPFLKLFQLDIQYSLDIARQSGSLSELTALILPRLETILEKERPDNVIVQGDTTTTLTCALAAFYQKIPVAHIEAGLRTHDKYTPFPEEMNRRLTSQIATIHFPPTEKAKENLISERISGLICVTGNSAIDCAKMTHEALSTSTSLQNQFIQKYPNVNWNSKIVLVTCHRRENIGKPMEEICDALANIIQTHHDIEIILPLHLNPNVLSIIKNKLSHKPRIHLVDPLEYQDCIYIMSQCYMIVTDSGGIQEEAPYFNVPVLVLRNETERMEGVEAGTSILIGTDQQNVFNAIHELLISPERHQAMSAAKNPFGDGTASKKMIQFLQQQLNEKKTRGMVPESIVS